MEGEKDSILDNPLFMIFLSSTLIFFCAVGTLGEFFNALHDFFELIHYIQFDTESNLDIYIFSQNPKNWFS